MRPPLSKAELALLPSWAAALSTCTTALPTGGRWVGWVGDRLSSVVRIPIEVAGPRQPLNQVVQSPNQWGPTSTCRNGVCFPVSSQVSHMGQLRDRRPVLLLLLPSIPRCLAHPPQLLPPSSSRQVVGGQTTIWAIGVCRRKPGPHICHCEIWKSGMATIRLSFSICDMGTSHNAQGWDVL